MCRIHERDGQAVIEHLSDEAMGKAMNAAVGALEQVRGERDTREAGRTGPASASTSAARAGRAQSKALTGGLDIRAALAAMAVTPLEEARQQLEATSAGRRQMWGHLAVRVPVLEGDIDEIVSALDECLAADFEEGAGTSVVVDKQETLGGVDLTFRPNLDAAHRAYYLDALAKHRRKKGEAGSVRVTKLNIKVYCGRTSTFRPHEVLRVSDDRYLTLPCCVRQWAMGTAMNAAVDAPE